MRRVRLRDAYPAEVLAKMYRQPHDHGDNPDHRLRIAVTCQLARVLVGPVASAADLSCGDGGIIAVVPARAKYLGDYAPGWAITGPIESTIDLIPPVDLFICTETIEHLDDPDTTLKAIRGKATNLIVSTPVGAWHDRSRNREHYWAWDRDAVEEMLRDAGFRPTVYLELDFSVADSERYRFGIWGCR